MIETEADVIRVIRQNPRIVFRALHEDAELLAEVRRLILTEEVLAMPAKLDEVIERQDLILLSQRNTETRIERLSDDFGRFRGNYAESAAREAAYGIVMKMNSDRELGIDETRIRQIPRDGILALAREYGGDRFAEIPFGTRFSFYKSDIIMEAVKLDGEICYIAVEASYTCDERDTARATTHAELLTRLTGKEAWPAIAGVRVDRRIQPLIDGGEVFWYQLEEDEMNPPEPD